MVYSVPVNSNVFVTTLWMTSTKFALHLTQAVVYFVYIVLRVARLHVSLMLCQQIHAHTLMLFFLLLPHNQRPRHPEHAISDKLDQIRKAININIDIVNISSSCHPTAATAGV